MQKRTKISSYIVNVSVYSCAANRDLTGKQHSESYKKKPIIICYKNANPHYKQLHSHIIGVCTSAEYGDKWPGCKTYDTQNHQNLI